MKILSVSSIDTEVLCAMFTTEFFVTVPQMYEKICVVFWRDVRLYIHRLIKFVDYIMDYIILFFVLFLLIRVIKF